MSFFNLKDGMRLYYEDCGQGNTVIFIHGILSSHEVYSKTVRILKKKCRCIVYDQRGHGKSRSAGNSKTDMEVLASDLNEIIQGLSLSNVTLAGWSMGAGIAMTYIKNYGCSALKQVVLCDMTPKQINEGDWKLGLYQGKYTRKTMEQESKKSRTGNYISFMLNTIPSLKKMPLPKRTLFLFNVLKNCNIKTVSSLADSLRQQDNREVIPEISVPLFYFYAVPGSIFSPDLAKWYRSKAKAPFYSLAFRNSSHMLITENPAKFAHAIAKILTNDI